MKKSTFALIAALCLPGSVFAEDCEVFYASIPHPAAAGR